jgi:hypothetical protein
MLTFSFSSQLFRVSRLFLSTKVKTQKPQNAQNTKDLTKFLMLLSKCKTERGVYDVTELSCSCLNYNEWLRERNVSLKDIEQNRKLLENYNNETNGKGSY